MSISFYLRCDIGVNQLIADFACPFQNWFWHTGKSGYLYTITPVCTTLDNLAEEDNVVALFLYSNTEIIDGESFPSNSVSS